MASNALGWRNTSNDTRGLSVLPVRATVTPDSKGRSKRRFVIMFGVSGDVLAMVLTLGVVKPPFQHSHPHLREEEELWKSVLLLNNVGIALGATILGRLVILADALPPLVLPLWQTGTSLAMGAVLGGVAALSIETTPMLLLRITVGLSAALRMFVG